MWAAWLSLQSACCLETSQKPTPTNAAANYIDIEPVATGDTTRGVDEYGRQVIGLGGRKPHAQRTGFMELPAAGDAVFEAHVERDLAPGPVGRKDR